MKICNACGAEMNDNDRFCMSCGADQKAAETATATETVETAEPVTEAEPVVEPVTAAPTYDYQPAATTDTTYTYDEGATTAAPGDGKATASMVCGIVGICLCCCGPLGVAALILGILAKKDGSTSGKATAGIIMGAIVTALWILSLIFQFATGFDISSYM